MRDLTEAKRSLATLLEISRCSRGVKVLAPPRGKFSSVDAAMVTAEALSVSVLVFLFPICCLIKKKKKKSLKWTSNKKKVQFVEIK
jgi:hypothetical protein